MLSGACRVPFSPVASRFVTLRGRDVAVRALARRSLRGAAVLLASAAAWVALAGAPVGHAPETAQAAKRDAPSTEFRVGPRQQVKRSNETPRQYRARRLGRARVDVALFTCERIRGRRDPRFDHRGGQARRGAPDAEITAVNGRMVDGSRDRVSRVKPRRGRIRLEVAGRSECIRPVVFRDRDRDRRLDVRRGDGPGAGRAKEPLGVGSRTRFVRLGVDTATADRCDFLDPAVCLQPWPNDHFTRRSSSTDTGRRLALDRESMPQNRAGVPIEPSAYNRSDGFSPGQLITTRVPGLDTQRAFRRTGAVPITDIARHRDAAQPVVVINARTGERHPIWSEVDANPDDPSDANLLIRPAVNFDGGERYIVALRDLRDSSGEVLKAGRGFRVYKNRIITSEPEVERHRPHMERVFRQLRRAGVGREGLYLAWDFTVASERNLTERALHLRDDAFAQLGDTDLSDLDVQGDAPDFTVTRVQDFDACGDDGCAQDPVTGDETESDTVARRVEGQVVVPCYLDQPGCPSGSRFAYAEGSSTPRRIPGNTTLANFICNVPRAAVDGGVDPARPSLYGHGLLGSADEVGAGNVEDMGNEHNFVFCATDWAGFSTRDVPNVVTILQDLSRFPTLVDHSQQGFLNFMYLGRLMVHPDGFSSHPAFRFEDGAEQRSAIDTERLFYDGNSQGGILGGALTALAPDFDRAVLGVPGMNYSTLLRRSVDFDVYAEAPGVGLYANYPNELERPLILSLIQTLWDRGEANGYAHHMTDDPLPDTPPHEVLLHAAFGDHQVANVSAEVEARTIGARLREPALDPGRHTDVDPIFGLPAIGSFPFAGSALVYWDTGPVRAGGAEGTPPPPTTNVPPREGNDPHGAPRGEVLAREQKSEFLRVDGRVVDVCGDAPCYADGYGGP